MSAPETSPAGRRLADQVRRRQEAVSLEKLAHVVESGAIGFLLFQAAVLIGLVVSGQL